MSFIDRIFKKLGYVPSLITRNLTCAWCGEHFEWSGRVEDSYPTFCKETHRKRSSVARKKRKENSQTPPKKRARKNPKAQIDLSRVGRCPNPYKITFRTREEAEEVIKRVDPTMHIYKCECGGMHIGHRKKTRT